MLEVQSTLLERLLATPSALTSAGTGSMLKDAHSPAAKIELLNGAVHVPQSAFPAPRIETLDRGLSITETNVTPLPLPEKRHIECFFRFAYPYLPIFNVINFQQNLATADTSVLYAMSALGLRFQIAQDRSMRNDFSKADTLYKEAKRLVELQYVNPKIATLQTLILLENYTSRTFPFLISILSKGS
jgi:hypothetical protein